MSTLILNNPKITINSVDLSTHIDQITIEQLYADIDISTFGVTSKQHAAGLSDNKCTLNFFQDYAAASVDATIFPLLGGTTTIACLPVNAATTTTNPSYTFTVVVLSWKPMDGKVGNASQISVTWPISGNIVKANS